MRYDRELRVLCRADRIPNASKVTKRNGEKEYILRRSIPVYRADGLNWLHPNEGYVFLVADGVVDEIPNDKNLLMVTTDVELGELLELDEIPSDV